MELQLHSRAPAGIDHRSERGKERRARFVHSGIADIDYPEQPRVGQIPEDVIITENTCSRSGSVCRWKTLDRDLTRMDLRGVCRRLDLAGWTLVVCPEKVTNICMIQSAGLMDSCMRSIRTAGC